MDSQNNLYKVTVKRKMGMGTGDNGLMESQTMYFSDIGDIGFAKRLVNKLEHGMGAHNVDFIIAHIECLGEIQTTEV